MNKFTDIKAVLLDMDGTLIEHTWQLSQITEALFAKFAPDLAPLTAEVFYKVFWDKNADLWFMMVDGVIDGDTAQVYSYINTLRKLGKDTSLAPKMVDYWSNLVLQEAVPFEETEMVLKTLRSHFVTAIVTNGFITLQRAKLSHYALDQAVDFSFVSEEVGFHKPDVRIFKQVLQKMNISADQAIFVGDSLKADIEGALNAGIQPVFIDASNQQTAPTGVPKITRLKELLNLLPLDS